MTSHPHGLAYRPDIDGLRAVAILSVLLYHARIPGFGGGYVGVDIFFVISGYVISRTLLRDLAEGRLALADFYERRVRRIAPALVAVLGFVLCASTFLLLPYDLRQTARATLAAVSFTANIEFWLQAGYFGADAQYKPLLHLWSLAIEEQFYLLYPPLLLLTRKWPRVWLAALLALSWCLSFALCIWITRNHSDAGFFLTPFRAWELLSGCILALCPHQTVLPRPLREILSAAGLLAIGYSVVAFSDAPGFAFPGPVAILPCGGAVLLILANSGGQTLTKRLLSLRPVVFVGLISYSLYLWHWPLFALTHAWVLAPLSWPLQIFMLGASFILAIFSWRWIEQPFRKRNGIFARSPLFAAAVIAACLVAVLAICLIEAKGWPERFGPQIRAVTAFMDYRQNPIRQRLMGLKECSVSPNGWRDYKPDICFSPQAGKANILLWGDSHAAHFSQTLTDLMERHGGHIMQATSGACRPSTGNAPSAAHDCQAFNRLVVELLDRRPVDAVVLSANWLPLTRNDRAGAKEAVFLGIRQTLNFLRTRNIPVILVGQSPFYSVPLPTIVARAIATNQNPDRLADALLVPGIFERDSEMKAAFGHSPGILYVSLMDEMCPNRQCRALTQNGVPIMFDTQHYTLEGSRLTVDIALARAVLSVKKASSLR